MDDLKDDSVEPQESTLSRYSRQIRYRYQSYVDRCVPHPVARWVVACILFTLYALRVTLVPGWYIVTYALGIYILSLFLEFLTPKIDPSALQSEDEDGPELPTRQNEEFKPFIRKLPEFKFWHQFVKALCYALFATCFKFTDVPVFWPILLLYFITLVILTMKKQIKHMIKYKYLPFSRGKTVYQGKPEH